MRHTPIIRTRAGVLISALVAACAYTRVTRFDPTAELPQRTQASDIKFYGAMRPRCPYDEIGRISAESRPFVSWNRDKLEELRYEGYGPAGVAIEETSSLSGIVIRFRHPDCMD